MAKELNIKNLSPHLFWDVDPAKLNFKKNKKLIVQRVLEYGLMDDFKLLYQTLGIDEIAAIAMTLRELDDRTLTFIATLSKIPKDQFRCYTIRQSIPRHWNF